MNATHDQEKILLNQCLQGSSEAWRAFVRKYSPLVYYSIRKVLYSKRPEMSREAISDLHNEVFVALMDKNGHKLRQYKGTNGCSVSTWIRLIATRATIDYLRKQRDILSFSDEASKKEAEKKSIASKTPLQHMEEEEQKKILRELMDQLSAKEQLFLRLFYYDEVSPQQIAKIFNTTPNAVYSRGNYLREKLKQFLKKKLSKK